MALLMKQSTYDRSSPEQCSCRWIPSEDVWENGNPIDMPSGSEGRRSIYAFKACSYRVSRSIPQVRSSCCRRTLVSRCCALITATGGFFGQLFRISSVETTITLPAEGHLSNTSPPALHIITWQRTRPAD